MFEYLFEKSVRGFEAPGAQVWATLQATLGGHALGRNFWLNPGWAALPSHIQGLLVVLRRHPALASRPKTCKNGSWRHQNEPKDGPRSFQDAFKTRLRDLFDTEIKPK